MALYRQLTLLIYSQLLSLAVDCKEAANRFGDFQPKAVVVSTRNLSHQNRRKQRYLLLTHFDRLLVFG